MTNVIDIYFDSVGSTATAPSKLWQWSKGQIVRINGLDLPTVYQVHFSNNPTLGTAEPVAVSGNVVSIPDIYLTTGEPVYLFIWLSDETSAETIRKGTIYVAKRSQPSGAYDPTAEQQTIIDGLIGSINTAVDTAEGYANSAQTYSGNAATSATEALNAKDAAQGYAEQASQTAQGVEILVNRAEDAADDAETAKQDVEQLKQAVEGLADDAESAKTDAETARGEAQGFAQTASTKASEAVQSASQASQSATTATEQAQTATAKATEASQSAETATTKASEASASATTATTKASEASTSASTATTAKNDAVTAKNAAITAKTGAETARTGAETAAQSVSASAAQIAANTSDITDLKEDLHNVWEIKWIPGYVNMTGIISDAGTDRRRTDYIPVREGIAFTAKLESNHRGVSAVTFYDHDYHVIQVNVNADNGGTAISHSYTVPKDAAYMLLSTKPTIGYEVTFDPPILMADNTTNDSILINDNSINVEATKALLELADNPVIPGVKLGLYFPQSATLGLRIYSRKLPVVGDYIKVTCSNDLYRFSIRVSDSMSMGSSWVTAYTQALADADYLMLWVKRADETVMSADELETVRGALTVEYGFDEANLLRGQIARNVIDIAMANKNFTDIQVTNTNVKSGCTFNADGSITIAAGGYYFPSYPIKTAVGNVRIEINLDPVIDIKIAPSAVDSTGGVSPFIPMVTTDDHTKAIEIDMSQWSDEYPYAIIRIDNRTGNSEITINSITMADMHVNGGSGASTAYVSTTGNDDGFGTLTAPYATVNRALQSGASVVIIGRGVYKQTIDLSYAKTPNVEFRNGETCNRVIFESPNSVLATSETRVSGYTSVYSAPLTATFTDGNNWIYQDGVADASTLIDDAERHPLQRGYEYRCEDTRIVKCAATTLSDALTEIENADTYKWFADTDNATLYFSRPQGVTESNPICYSDGSSLFSNGSKRISLKAVGIETKYMMFNIVFLSSAEILECKAVNAFGAGGFRYDRCQNAMFIRCEAARTNIGTTGDGFNGHSLSSGDVFSKQTNVTLFDCYSHDNNDDGYSDHERSEITIIGGLYEYNGKAGVTPSYGSHCTCYNVISRHNYAGFFYTGEATADEGGKYGQMVCFNCIAEKNDRGGWQTGFKVDGNGNSAVLYNCKSIQNPIGYKSESNTTMTLYDCTSKDDATIKGPGNIVIKNTEIVS